MTESGTRQAHEHTGEINRRSSAVTAPRVLVVEDEADLGLLLTYNLEAEGFSAEVCERGDEAELRLEERPPDLVILDLGMPDGDGMDLLRDLRGWSSVPVIVLSARVGEQDKIEALDAGADDYVVKPFDLEELLARIRARIRSREGRASDQLSAHGVAIDLAARTATKDDAPVFLTAKEFKVLAVLMRRIGQFVGKPELEAALYDSEAEVESNTIETAIYALRRKLGADLILTARGLGYTIPRSR